MLARATSAGVAALLLFAGASRGQWLSRWADQPTMTGDWGGLRTRWNDAGISIFATYGINLAGNPVGGLEEDTTYTDDQSWGADFDLGKLFCLDGSAVRLSFNNRDGVSLSSDIGALFAVQQLFGGGERPRLMELAITQTFLDGKLNVRAGRVMGASDFATSPLYCEYMNQALCGNLGNLGKNITFSFYPVSSWGGRVQWTPDDSNRFLVQAGVFEANPTLVNKDGFDWSTAGAIGTVTIGEFWYTPGAEHGYLPGHYKLGAYYSSANVPDLYFDADGRSYVESGQPPLEHSGQSGVYFLADQAVMREAEEGNQGLTALGGIAFASEATNTMPFFFFLGLQYTGAFAGRPDDILGFSVAQGRISSNLAATQRLQGQLPQDAETLFELNYSMRLTNWFVFEPNVQYILTPGGTGAIPNAFVLGLQTTLTF
ncbi:MAG: carbohydrate porin [Thermoanaerobaculia bacterium]